MFDLRTWRQPAEAGGSGASADRPQRVVRRCGLVGRIGYPEIRIAHQHAYLGPGDCGQNHCMGGVQTATGVGPIHQEPGHAAQDALRVSTLTHCLSRSSGARSGGSPRLDEAQPLAPASLSCGDQAARANSGRQAVARATRLREFLPSAKVA